MNAALLLFQTLCFCCRSPANRPLPALSADPSCGSAIVSHSASTTNAGQALWRESTKIPAAVDFFCKRTSNVNASGDGTCFIKTCYQSHHHTSCLHNLFPHLDSIIDDELSRPLSRDFKLPEHLTHRVEFLTMRGTLCDFLHCRLRLVQVAL